MAVPAFLPYDQYFFDTHLKDFLPDTFVDCHTHLWLDSHNHYAEDTAFRSCSWPTMVASENSIEELLEINRVLFPGKTVKSVLYGQPAITVDLKMNNSYIAEHATRLGFGALYIPHPTQSAASVERHVLANPCFKGLKVYLQYAPEYVPTNEIRIFDFLTHEHLALANRHHWVVQLHIARPNRLADPVNYMQIAEIEEKYPDVQLIIAHLGRAYADQDLGDSLEVLKHSKSTIWDFTANTNSNVMKIILDMFGPDRFMYGSDFPIFQMKARRTVENGFYINEVPQGSLGDVSGDPHMREIAYPEAEKISYFIYEEILSCKRACEALGLGKSDVEKIFCGTATRVFGL